MTTPPSAINNEICQDKRLASPNMRIGATPAPYHRRRMRMPGFVLVSLCLHAGLVLPWMLSFSFAGQRETILTLTLDAPHRVMAPHSSQAYTNKTIPSPTKMAETARAFAVVYNNSTQARTDDAGHAAQSTDAGGNGKSQESARAQIQARLLTDLKRYFEYPMLARKQGWQGTVWLSFTLDFDGALANIRVARSSGYDVLDNSAITAMRKVGQLDEAKYWLNGEALDMRMPIIYRLEEY